MALYTNIAGFRNIGQSGVIRSDSGMFMRLPDTSDTYNPTLTIEPVIDPTGSVFYDPGITEPVEIAQPLPVPTNPTYIDFTKPETIHTNEDITTVPLPPPSAQTDTTTQTTATVQAQTTKNWFPMALAGGLILLAVTGDNFIPKGKRLLYLGGIGYLYYLSTKTNLSTS